MHPPQAPAGLQFCLRPPLPDTRPVAAALLPAHPPLAGPVRPVSVVHLARSAPQCPRPALRSPVLVELGIERPFCRVALIGLQDGLHLLHVDLVASEELVQDADEVRQAPRLQHLGRLHLLGRPAHASLCGCWLPGRCRAWPRVGSPRAHRHTQTRLSPLARTQPPWLRDEPQAAGQRPTPTSESSRSLFKLRD